MTRSIVLILMVIHFFGCADQEEGTPEEIVLIFGGTRLQHGPSDIDSASANMIVAYLVGEYYERKGVWPSSETDLRRSAEILDWGGIDALFERLRVESFEESRSGIRVHYSVGSEGDRESGQMYMEGEQDRENGAQQTEDANSVNPRRESENN